MKTTQATKQKKSRKVACNKGSNTKLTPENRVKLEQAAAIDATVEEMAYYCDVSRQTVYNWFKEDKELFDKVERLRQKPILTARQTIAKGVAESYSNAMDYLKRKKRLEFGDVLRNEMTGKDGKKLIIQVTSETAQRYGLTPESEDSSTGHA